MRLENWFVQAFCDIVSQFGDMLRCVFIIFNLYDDMWDWNYGAVLQHTARTFG